jgi:stage V sporulation protein G
VIDSGGDQLLAFCTVTFDRAFVVRDIRVINGPNGPFVAMPSRRVSVSCSRCQAKNYLGSKYCAECGTKMPAPVPARNPERHRGYVDIAHPINAKSRDQIQSAILQSYEEERIKSRQPNYSPRGTEGDSSGEIDLSTLDTRKATPHWQADRAARVDQGGGNHG